MSPARMARVRRLLADVLRPETRGDALRRVRRRAASELRERFRRPGSTAAATRAGAGTPAAPGATRRPEWYVGEWVRLAAAVLGPGVGETTPPDPALAPETASRAASQRAQAVFAEGIARGEPLERAVCRAVAALAATGDWRDLNAAWAIAEGVARLPGGTAASALGHALLLHRRRQIHRAWNVVQGLDDAVLASHIPIAAVDAALAAGTAEARRRALEIGAPTAAMDAAALVDLAGRFLAFGECERAAALVSELRGRSSVDLDERRRRAGALIERRLDRRLVSVPPGSVPVAVMDYRTPDPALTPGTDGDYLQTLAMLGNLVRLDGLALSGEDGLGELAAELKDRVRPGLRIPDVRGAVHLVPVDRDFSTAGELPEGTWMVASGWHMHPLYELRYDFPYHPNVRPLFVSFHVNSLEMLSDEVLAYLRRYGPVGCRDWTTVFLLLGAGVDAFFTGCVTTTVDGLFPAREAVHRRTGIVGVIDLPGPSAGGARNARVYRLGADESRVETLADGLRAASDALAACQRDLDRAVTGRLEAYLSLTALGVPVEFKPRSPGDVQLAGLTGLRPGDARLAEMRDGIRELTATVLARVAAGAAEAEVYALWRDLTRERVAEAQARLEAPVARTPTTVDVAAAVATSRAGSRRSGPHEAVDRDAVTDVVLAFDQNLTLPAGVLIESMVANATGPLRLWVLGRGLPAGYAEWLARAFPSLPITVVPCDDIAYGPAGRPRRIPLRITISTMDRLILPDLLDEVNRVVYLDVDTLLLDDVCRLARTDLGGRPLAARDSTVTEASEWRRAGRHLPIETATDLRRWMGVRHGYGHPALNAGVLVLDLERMRRDGFTTTYLGMVEQYGLNDQDTMLAYVGPDRCVLDPRWNALPALEDVPDPSLVHWASLGKPWEPALTYGQDRWLEHAARLRDRVGAPPSAAG